MIITPFTHLSELFSLHGYNIYAVGGTVRDFLLGLKVHDYDFVTNATPAQIMTFLPEKQVNSSFARFGTLKYKFDIFNVDIATMRQEDHYIDARHPQKITFVDDLFIDSCRRDFTINALYMDYQENIYDFHGGRDDLKNRILRCIGEADKRMKEDSLRIVRACRFAATLGLSFDCDLRKSIIANKEDLRVLKPQKVKEEIGKCHEEKKLRLFEIFRELGIMHIIDELNN